MTDRAPITPTQEALTKRLEGLGPIYATLTAGDVLMSSIDIRTLSAPASARAIGDLLLARLEERRREQATSYVAFRPSALDYSYAGKLIDAAVHHLDESLPNNQHARTRLALATLQLGAEILVRYLNEDQHYALGAVHKPAAAPPAEENGPPV